MQKKNIQIFTVGTFFLLSNMGSFLQHWSLRYVLKRYGYDTYRTPRKNDNSLYSINNYIWLLQYIKQCVKIILSQLRIDSFSKNNLNASSLRFYHQARHFKKDFISNIGNCVEEMPERTDVLVFGGDQVFSEYCLELADDVSADRKIIYGASTDWPNSYKDNIIPNSTSRHLSHYQNIGVREESGADIITQNGIKAIRVADPVMLIELETLNSLVSHRILFKKPTLFCYYLNIKNQIDFPLSDLYVISRQLNVGLKMNGIQGAELFMPSKYYVSLGPCDFLKAISTADYVITNSYHATLLAIMYHKPFISVRQKDQNIRQYELLKLVGLENHSVKTDNLLKLATSLLNEKVDWDYVDRQIDELRCFSLKWLKDNLNESNLDIENEE